MWRILGYAMTSYVGVNIYAAVLPHSPALGAFILGGLLLSVRPIGRLLVTSMRQGAMVDNDLS